MSPWGFPGRWGETTAACPEMPPVFLYLPSLGQSRPSWIHPPYSFHCVLLIFTVNALTCAATAVSIVFRYRVPKILCKQNGCICGQHLILLSSFFFFYRRLFINLHVLQVMQFDLLDVSTKPSITYCTFTPSFVLPLWGTFHLFFVAETLASSHSFVTLMKNFLLDQPKPLSSCASVLAKSRRAAGRRSWASSILQQL